MSSKTVLVALTSGTIEHVNLVADTLDNVQARIVEIGDLSFLSGDYAYWVFVDWLLPVMAGVQFVRLLRQLELKLRPHIVMVLPDGSDDCRSRALQAGADDYVVGPLTPPVLLDRLRTYRQGIFAPRRPATVVGKLRVDHNAFVAHYDGRRIAMGQKEFRLLSHLSAHANRVFSRGELIEVLGGVANADRRCVDVWMSRLRRALARANVPDLPRTVRSYGYVFDIVGAT